MAEGFGFYRIHILQSLREGDMNTGLHLFRSLQSRSDTEGHVEFTRIAGTAELLGALSSIRHNLQETGQIPLIHLEVHGKREGFELSSGDFLDWSQLKEILTEINVDCKSNLFIAVSACQGENLVRMVRLTDPAPFWGCLGPREESVQAGALLDTFTTFYANLLDVSDVRQALEACGGGLPFDNKPFVLWPAHYFFMVAYRGYLETLCTPEALRQRANFITTELMRLAGEQVSLPPDLRARIFADLNNHEPFFEAAKRSFFMLDRFPENERRFEVEFSRIRGRVAPNTAPATDG
jgi:hypothetical protein